MKARGIARSSSRFIRAVQLLILSVVLLLVGCGFCDCFDNPSVRVENSGPSNIIVCAVNPDFRPSGLSEACYSPLVPGDEVTVFSPRREEPPQEPHIYVVRLKDIEGLYTDEQEFTWYQLRDQEWRIFVTDDGIVPPSSEQTPVP